MTVKAQLHEAIVTQLERLIDELGKRSVISFDDRVKAVCLFGGLTSTMFGTNCEAAARYYLSYAFSICAFTDELLPILLPHVIDPLRAYGLLDDKSIMNWMKAEFSAGNGYTSNANAFFNKSIQRIDEAVKSIPL